MIPTNAVDHPHMHYWLAFSVTQVADRPKLVLAALLEALSECEVDLDAIIDLTGELLCDAEDPQT